MKLITLTTLAELHIMATLTMHVCEANDAYTGVERSPTDRGNVDLFAEAKQLNLVVNDTINSDPIPRGGSITVAASDALLTDLQMAADLCAEDLDAAGLCADQSDDLDLVIGKLNS